MSHDESLKRTYDERLREREEAHGSFDPANGSEDLEMMTEWAESLCSRLESMDLRHAQIALEWFHSFAKSKIQRAEELRAIEAILRLSPPNNEVCSPSDGSASAKGSVAPPER